MDELIQNDEQRQLQNLLRQLDLINRPQKNIYSQQFDNLGIGLKSYGGSRVNPYAALLSELGKAQIEASPIDKSVTAKASRQDVTPFGFLSTEISKGINTPEEKLQLMLQNRIGNGEFTGRATVGTDQYNQALKMIELQYLKEILKNIGLGAYYTGTPQGQSAGLRIQGRF
jgi:hypothetical protein